MTVTIGRRELLAALCGAAASWPLAARAQAKRPLIGFLSVVLRERNVSMVNAFMQGLRELDYVEGRDFDFVLSSADGHLDRLPSIAEKMVQLQPSVILATVTPAVVAVRTRTKTIPIVCPFLADPIRYGLIESESRPGGNVTGILFRVEGLAGKQLEFGLQMVPGATKIGMLANVAAPLTVDRQEAEGAAKRLGVTLIPAEVRAPEDLNAAFQALANDHVQAVIVLVDGMFFNERERIAQLAAATRLPAFYAFRDHVDAGGLISYGVNLAECFRRAAGYVVKILKGAKPGDLPVEFPTKLELVINAKAAKALGLQIPPALLTFAEEVIERIPHRLSADPRGLKTVSP
jgi:putative ABC transport system substrate-binding protein